jgi:hypothetical protein
MSGWRELISDESNRISSKRVAGLLCVLALVVTLVARPSNELVNAVSLVAFGTLGLTSIDKFTKK